MCSNTNINRLAYNLIAKNYKEEHGELEWRNELDKFIKLIIVQTPRILDLGCGPGLETLYIKEKLSNSNITGVDISEEMIKIAQDSTRSNSKDINFIVHDITNFSIDGEKVDGVWARASLHHLSLDQIVDCFQNISGMMKPGAIFAMVNKYGAEEEIEEKQKYGELLKRSFQYFDEDLVNHLSNKYNFSIKEQYIFENDHKWLVSFLVKK